jgi:hypothetical protein
MKLTDVLKEIKINKPNGDLKYFVNINKQKIWNFINQNENTESTGITNIKTAIVDYGYEPDGNTSKEVIIISQTEESLESCEGILITTLPPDWWDTQGSGYNFKLLEDIKFKNKSLYFDFIWC